MTTITTSFTIDATISSFDETAFKQSLASSLNVSATDISLVVTAGSLIVDVTVTTSVMSTAVSVSNTLAGFVSDPTLASTQLGVTVTAVTAPASTTTTVSSPPSSTTLVTAGSAQTGDDDSGCNTNCIIGAGVGGGVAVIIMFALLMWMCGKCPCASPCASAEEKPAAYGSSTDSSAEKQVEVEIVKDDKI